MLMVRVLAFLLCDCIHARVNRKEARFIVAPHVRDLGPGWAGSAVQSCGKPHVEAEGNGGGELAAHCRAARKQGDRETVGEERAGDLV